MRVQLRCVDPRPSQVVAFSLPMPPFHATVAVPGAEQVQVTPLGRWPARALLNPAVASRWDGAETATPDPLDNPPRRCLVHARFAGPAPDVFDVVVEPGRATPPCADGFPVTLAVTPGAELYHHRDEALYHHVKREDSVRIVGHDTDLTLRLGWRIDGAMRYWQWVQIIPVWRGPLTQAFTVGGHLYAGPVDRMMTMDEARHSKQTPFYAEATVAARAFLVLHRDGQVEMTVHYANTEAYGNGCSVEGLPVVEWTRAAAISTERWWAEEGRISSDDEGCRWQWSIVDSPRIYLGHRTQPYRPEVTDVTVEHAAGSEERWLEGVARSASAVLSLAGPATPPRRALAAPAWYLRCGEFGIALSDQRSDAFPGLQALSDAAVPVFLRNAHREGMSRGGIYRYLDVLDGRHELSMDGNEATQLFRGAYLRTHGDLYRTATLAARCIADIAIDHNDFNVHYHADSPAWHTYSMIYLRFGGLVTLWQESGDPWYLELAEAVGNRWIALNRVNHPRQNMGRDAEPVEGILQLYDATGKDHYFVEAERIACDVARSLFDDGSWRSGHGVGPFWGINALQGSPWNGSHLLAGIAEYLARACPHTSAPYSDLLASAVKLVRELLRKVRDDCAGFHRATGSFLPRRHYLVAHLANDDGLRQEVLDAVRRLEQEFTRDGAAFYRTGHHCAGYLDSPAVLLALEAERGLTPGSRAG